MDTMTLSNQIIAEAADYVSDYLSKHLDKAFCYHDFFHTFSVVTAVNVLCFENGIKNKEKRILLIAAWFHDIGYTITVQGHEQHSAWMAADFLKHKEVADEQIEIVKACILATRYPQQPANLLEQILCDADMFYLNESNFMQRSKLLKKEWELTGQKKITDDQWYEMSIKFLNEHSFHTAYCRKQFEQARLNHVTIITAELEQLKQNAHIHEVPVIDAVKKQKPPKPPRLERGVETLFRMTSGNHIKLSAMADTKAHILLSINSVIISVVLSVLVRKLSKLPYLIFLTALLLAVNLVSMAFAVLATKPRQSAGVFTAAQIQSRQANLLFFGNFHRMDLESFQVGIQEIMYDKDYLYKSLTKDIYFLGKALAGKYRYLAIGYKVFMFGLIGAVIAFGICLVFKNQFLIMQ